MSNNLRIWNQVCATDPAHTKAFNKGGGFKGTSINPTYNNRKLTEVFGLCGIGWGFDVKKEEYINGHYISDKDREVTHVIRILFWFKDGEKLGKIPSFGQTTYIGKNKNGIFTDEEAPKKSLTDAITKASSMLGFGADIFMGMYDDVKYVNDLKNKTIEDLKKIEAATWKDSYIAKLDNIKNKEELMALQTDNQRHLEKLNKNYPDIGSLITKRTTEMLKGLS